MQNERAIYDVIIIGGGAAGMSALLWCDELGLKTLLLEESDKTGGQLWCVYNPIENHLGAMAENGESLQKRFAAQIKLKKLKPLTRSRVVKINMSKKSLTLADGGELKWRFLIAATGVKRKKLGVAGEEKFKNQGIIESGKRDAKLVKNKCVAVIGGGDAALENALILAETAREVIIIHRRRDFRARAEFLTKAEKSKKIKFITETVVTKFDGAKHLESLELENIRTKEKSALPVDAALLRIGVEPNTKLFRGKLDLDKHGYIKIDAKCETSAKNIYAIGDAANPLAPTVSSAVGMGATAAKVIFSKLNSES